MKIIFDDDTFRAWLADPTRDLVLSLADKKPRREARSPRDGSLRAWYIAGMDTCEGISVAEAMKKTGWGRSTAQSEFTQISKKLDRKVEKYQDASRGLVYRFADFRQ
ncbi:MAG: hypothetical protein JSR99_09910 [Proteobacteria bacterium]|nr:hypothetical protein [Pseudomonadota bacterium]